MWENVRIENILGGKCPSMPKTVVGKMSGGKLSAIVYHFILDALANEYAKTVCLAVT